MTNEANGTEETAEEGSKKWYWGPLVIVVLTQFIIVIDSTMMNVSISALVKDLNTDITTIQGIIAGYTLIMASLLLLGARLLDIFGRKKTFIIALIIYTIGTTTAALSTSPGMLFFGWSFLEGVGAAVMLPATLAIINVEYRGKDKALAFGAWGAMAAAGAAFGPILGGFFTTFLSWRYAFGMEALIALGLLFMTPMLTESKSIMKFKQLDITGAVVSAAALFLIIFGVLQGSTWGWWAAKDPNTSIAGLSPVPIMIVIGLVLLLVFAKWERRVKDRGGIPLLDPDMFKNRVFSVGNVTDMLESVVLGGMLFIIPVYLQSVVGSNAFETGLTLLPMTIMVFVFSLGAARLGQKISPKYIIMIGIVFTLIGTIYMRSIFGLDTKEEDLLLGLSIFGVGIGFMMSQLVNVTISTAGQDKSTEASGTVNTFEQFGNSLGTALIGAIVFSLVFANMVDGVIDEGLVPPDMDREEVQEELEDWFKRLKQGEDPNITEEDLPAVERVIDRSLADAMGAVMDVMSLMLVGMMVFMLAMPYVETVGDRKVKGKEAVLPTTVAKEKAKEKVEDLKERRKGRKEEDNGPPEEEGDQ